MTDGLVGGVFNLFLFVAPLLFRCGHCKKLAPEFEKLGETFKTNKDVLFANVKPSLSKLSDCCVHPQRSPSSGRSLSIISIEELQELRDLVLKLEMVISIPLGSQQKLACCPSCSVSL